MKTFREYLAEAKVEKEVINEADTVSRNMSLDKIKDIIESNKNAKTGDALFGVNGSKVDGAVFVEYDKHGLVYASNGSVTLLSIDEKKEITIYVDTKKLKAAL